MSTVKLQATFKSSEVMRKCIDSYVGTYLPDELDTDERCEVQFTVHGGTPNVFDGEDTTATFIFKTESKEETKVAECFIADAIMDYMMDFAYTGKVNITEVTQ